MKRTRCAYLAGPMRGKLDYNFDAFLSAAATLKEDGWKVMSPAQMDLDAGFDPRGTPQSKLTHEFVLSIVERDLGAIQSLNPKRDAVIVLPGWRKSRGARAEVAVARWLDIAILRYPGLEVVK